MDIRTWFNDLANGGATKAMPILSFPGVQLTGVSVRDMINDSALMARTMKAVADRCDMLASVSMMDLSVEADAFGADVIFTDDEVPTATGRIISDMADADALAVPNVMGSRTGKYVEAIRLARGLITDQPVFGGVIGPFSLAGRLMDMTEIMISCYEDPDLVHAVLEKTTRFIADYAAAFKSAGAHGVLMAEPAAGLLSPDLIEEFSTPYVKRIAESVRDDNFGLIYHNCGRTAPLVDSIKKIGADAYHFGNAVDMTELLSLMPSDVPVLGNIDPVSLIKNGTPNDVYAATISLLERCGGHKNFVPSSGCDIPPVAPWANIDAFFKAVEDFYKHNTADTGVIVKTPSEHNRAAG